MAQRKRDEDRVVVLGERVAEAARRAGFDIDSPRGGGKKGLADATGMSHASVSRMLAGQAMPDARFLEPLARAVDIEVRELLTLAGIIRHPDALEAVPRRQLAPEDAAAALGITDPLRARLLEELVVVLLRQDSGRP